MCELIDLEPCSVFSQTKRVARKSHTCHTCRCEILKGSPYISHFSIFDGTPTYEKQCAACETVTLEFKKEHGSYSNPSAMPELLRECVESEGGDSEMGKKWQAELNKMKLRGVLNA